MSEKLKIYDAVTFIMHDKDKPAPEMMQMHACPDCGLPFTCFHCGWHDGLPTKGESE